MVAVNLGIFLAQIGRQVLLVDADPDTPGLHTWLGSEPPAPTAFSIDGDFCDIPKAAVATGIAGLQLLQDTRFIALAAERGADGAQQLWRGIRSVETDVVIVDLPMRLDDFTLHLFCAADYRVCVTMPMPDAVEGTWRFLSSAWACLLEGQLAGNDAARSLLAHANRGFQPLTPRRIVERLMQLENPAAGIAADLSRTFHPLLVVNQIRIREDDELGAAMVSAATRWLGFIPVLLGSIGWDDNVWLAQRRGRPLLIEFARSRACKDLEQVVRRLMNLELRELVAPVPLPPATKDQNYYELLEIYPGASEEEVRRAIRQIRLWFGPGGISLRGACAREEQDDFTKQAETAHARLLDRFERRRYDREQFPGGFHRDKDAEAARQRSIAGTVAATQESLPEVMLTDDHFVDGAFLARVRRENNVELLDISNRAKVSIRYLQAIEDERYDDLPAAVYTRGFVAEFARFLKIDPRRAVRDFMSCYDAHMEKRK